MRKFYFIPSLILIGLFACEQDEMGQYPAKFFASTVVDRGITAFDEKGEIRDQAKIKALVDQYSGVIVDAKTIPVPDLKVTYWSADTVEIIWNDTVSSIRRVAKKGGLVYWESPDTITQFFLPKSKNGIPLEKYTPLYHVEYPVNPATGFSSRARQKPCMFAVDGGITIRLPLVNYVFKGPGFHSSSSGKNNDINIKCVDDFETGNLLLVQRFDVMLTRDQ